MSPVTLQTLYYEEYPANEVCFSQFITETIGKGGESYLILGFGINPKLKPRTCELGFIKCYLIEKEGKSLKLIHQTPCEDIPYCFAEYEGKLIAGIGSILRVYELGISKFLRKCENKSFNSPLV